MAAVFGAEQVSEFSRAAFGDALRLAVQKSPHLIATSRVGQSLVFLGDFIELVDADVRPRLASGQMVITDRGYLSKYVYQQVVLEGVLSHLDARALLDAIFLHILPRPTLTILLEAPAETIRRRLLERDEFCDDERMTFIERAATAANEFACTGRLRTVIVSSNRPIEETSAEVERTVREHLYL
jgi:thymidylate kinase